MLIHQESLQVSRGVTVVPLKTPYFRLLLSLQRDFPKHVPAVTIHGKLIRPSEITQICINQNVVSIRFGPSIILTESRWEDN